MRAFVIPYLKAGSAIAAPFDLALERDFFSEKPYLHGVVFDRFSRQFFWRVASLTYEKASDLVVRAVGLECRGVLTSLLQGSRVNLVALHLYEKCRVLSRECQVKTTIAFTRLCLFQRTLFLANAIGSRPEATAQPGTCRTVEIASGPPALVSFLASRPDSGNKDHVRRGSWFNQFRALKTTSLNHIPGGERICSP